MLDKLSIAGALAAVLIIPTSLCAQGVGGAVNAGAAVRGAVVQGIPTPADLEHPPHGRPSSALRWAVGDQLPGWAYRIRTGESVGELSDWNCVATSLEVGATRVAEILRLPAV